MKPMAKNHMIWPLLVTTAALDERWDHVSSNAVLVPDQDTDTGAVQINHAGETADG